MENYPVIPGASECAPGYLNLEKPIVPTGRSASMVPPKVQVFSNSTALCKVPGCEIGRFDAEHSSVNERQIRVLHPHMHASEFPFRSYTHATAPDYVLALSA